MTTREIKFRAWDGREKMYYPTTFEFGVSGVNGLTSIAVPLNGGGFCTTAYIMQYTGLKDKNGKEIYDGDILASTSELYTGFGQYPTGKFKTEICSIEWVSNNARYQERRLSDGWLNTLGVSQESLTKYSEVIGNIYENPELLGKVG
jgi:uncharacterized phage protein (TIGR01671 family)